MSIEKKFGGDINVQTAELIKDLKAKAEHPSGGASEFVDMLLDSFDIVTDYAMSETLPEDSDNIEADILTADLGLAFAAALENGAKFYVYTEMSLTPVETTVNYSIENPEVPVSISFVNTDESIDETWSADTDTSYEARTFTFGDEMSFQDFSWTTPPVE